MHPNNKALFGGLLGPYLSSASAPMGSAWEATLAQMVTTAAFSAWVSVIVQEVLALSPHSDCSEQVWALHPGSPGYKGEGGSRPWSLSTLIGHPRGPLMERGTLICGEAMSTLVRVSTLPSWPASLISFLLLNLTPVWSKEIVWTRIDTRTER